MKATELLPLSLVLFVFVTKTSVLTEARPNDVPVVDVDGNPLNPGSEYYVVPSTRGMGGGLNLKSPSHVSCSFDVVQEKSDCEYGLPLSIQPLVPHRYRTLTEGSSMKFSFPDTKGVTGSCNVSTTWKIQRPSSDSSGELWYVGVEGDKDDRSDLGAEMGWFSIVSFGRWGFSAYKLVYCTRDYWHGVSCSDITMYVDDSGVRHLAIVKDRYHQRPFVVGFFRVSKESDIKIRKFVGGSAQ